LLIILKVADDKIQFAYDTFSKPYIALHMASSLSPFFMACTFIL